MDPLLEQFLSEARENLAFIDQNIGEIGGDDPELLNSVFRAAHTLKGGSGIVGFESVKEITHHAEDLLDMLRGGKIEFQDSMVDALYDAFDEVMNLVEAAEETGDVVDADEETLATIVANLNEQMGKDVAQEESWSIPFTLVEEKSSIVNLPLHALRECNTKVAFRNGAIDEEFCTQENFYAIVFDVDDSCMVYGNDPVYALSLLGEKVLGVYTCINDENAKSILSGTEDEDGLLLRTQIIAFIKASYEEIEDALFNFIDELLFLPLDIETLLTLDVGEKGDAIDSLKELAEIASSGDIEKMKEDVANALTLVGEATIQHAQLQRFLDIAGLVDGSDIEKLSPYFANLYKGDVYSVTDVPTPTPQSSQSTTQEAPVQEQTQPTTESASVEVTESISAAIENIVEQQFKALEYSESEEDIARIIAILDKLRKFDPQMPEFSDKQSVASYLAQRLGAQVPQSAPEQNTQEEETVQQEVLQTQATQEVQESVQAEKKQESSPATTATKAKEKVNKPAQKEEKAASVVGKTVKIEQASIDSLMNVIGELLVAKNSLPYLADNVANLTHEQIKREIMEKYIFINRLSEQLQDLIMGMRMLPISYVFDRYPKLVRDIAKKLNKKVKLEMSGGDTKLDKNMIEMLADPMIHIMRNSLDHGIESPEVREQKGKNPTGKVELKAYAQSDRIIIEIIDDGAGINVDRVINKVLEKGLMTLEEIEALDDAKKAELVMLPGLSTAEEITEYSGRGVGMDVVKKSIESFGGTINISTVPNQGTTITLAIPMSLAVTSLLHVEMNSIHYGIPMDSVSETVKLEKEEIEYLNNEPFIYIRGEVIPLLFIKSMLDEEAMADAPLSIVVLNIKENRLAVVVNKFLGQLDVVQKPLTGIMEGHPLFSGTALLGNGQIIMSIDPIGLLSISQKLKEEIQVA